MKQAVAVGATLLGDKSEGKSGRYKKWNEKIGPKGGGVPDIIETGASDGGKDRLSEAKVYHNYAKNKLQFQPAFLGHIYAFANFEEGLRIEILGCKRRGRETDAKFDYNTGRGFFKGHDGAYHDSRMNKNLETIPLIHAEDGGFSPQTYAHAKRLARDAGKPGARDGTEYDGSWNAGSFLAHHMQRISTVIVSKTADMLIDGINLTKQRAAAASN